jgi:hypothetical protein
MKNKQKEWHPATKPLKKKLSPALLIICQNQKVSLTPTPAVYGRADCLPVLYQ